MYSIYICSSSIIQKSSRTLLNSTTQLTAHQKTSLFLMENPSSSRHFSATIFLVTIFILISSSGLVTSDINQDKKECSAQLSEFTACLPFVGGKEKSPTATCCTNLKKEINKTRKCLCLIVKDRNDPGLGFVLNATLALSLPTVCHTPGNASDCPGNFPTLQGVYENNICSWKLESWKASVVLFSENKFSIFGNEIEVKKLLTIKRWCFKKLFIMYILIICS